QDTTLTAPLSGTVLSLSNQVGDTVGSGSGAASSSSASSSSSSSAGGAGGASGAGGSGGSGGSGGAGGSRSGGSGSGGSGSSAGAFISLGNLTSMQVSAPFAEADAAKIKVGQAATFTFDAVNNLNLTGRVVQVAAAATTVSNVTNYYVTLALD